MDPLLTLHIGPSNTGKTRAGVIPQIQHAISNKTSFVALDCKGLLLPTVGNSLEKNGYTIITFDIHDATNSHVWNPLSMPYQLYQRDDQDQCYSVLDDLASDIFIDENDFWEQSAKDLFVGLCILLFNKATDISQINLRSIYDLALTGFQKFSKSNYVQEYLNYENNKYSILASSIQATIEAPSDTRQSILSVLYRSLRTFTANDTLTSILCGSSIEIDDVLGDRVALFLNYEDVNTGNAKILNVLIMQIFRKLISKRSQPDFAYPIYTFFLDDFLLLPKLAKLDNILLGHKNRNIGISLSINNVELLKKKYGNETTSVLLSNAEQINLFFDILKEYEKCFSNSDYRDALVHLDYSKMLTITLSGTQFTDIKPLLNDSIPQNFYKHYYQKPQAQPASYFEIDTYVKELKQNEYKERIAKLSGLKNEADSPSLDMLFELLKDFSG